MRRCPRASYTENGFGVEIARSIVVWDSFWDFLWSTILVFAFIAYLIILAHHR